MFSNERNCCNCYSCAKWCKGEQGERGLQGERGERGLQGERGERGLQGERGERGLQGERGEPFSRVYGMFAGTPLGPFSGAGMFNTTIIPVTAARPTTTPGAFVVNENGTVTVNESGIYLITSKVQVDNGHTANFFFQVNELGARSGSQGGYTVMNGGTATITTLYSLNAGDRVSNSISSTTEIYLTPFVDNLRTFSSVITMLKIADLPAGFTESDDDLSGLLIE